MFKSKRGSITFVAYIAMLFFAMYGMILFSNSISASNIQKKSIENIKNSYNVNVSEQQMKAMYNKYSTPITD